MKKSMPGGTAFDQPVVLRQPGIWSHVIVWSLVGSATGVVLWAAFAPLEQAVQAQGVLEPAGEVKEVRAPLSGVVRAVYVREGQPVTQGQLLFTLDPRANEAELAASRRVRDNLTAENRIYRALLTGVGQLTALTPEQQATLQESQRELLSRLQAAQARIRQLQEQLRQNNILLASKQAVLASNKVLLEDLKTLVEEGGLARIQYIQLQQTVLEQEGEVQRLRSEQPRIASSIQQAQAEMNNTLAVTRRDLLLKISDNERRIAELTRQLEQAQVAQQYQEVRSPASGVVFELQPHTPGFVANVNDVRPLLKIVPTNNLIGEVYITNKDIGFVAPGMEVDVRIDSFPFSEFGDVKGKLVQIGADALPPDNTYNFFRFPARIELASQTMRVNQRVVPLQSGMSITANIRTRNRTVLSIFTDLFTRQTEGLRYVR
ncbi:HlyD family type I secretion periplasmic adaptor subunit [Gloeomargaritales cyanobacterium VI4D9]|nr:HlyD family type I secretion periplasmic adaptor subunit [Gloeomargaritales cyanobacterium VI4D9]